MTRELSQPERDVLRLFGAGRSASEIATELGISQSTVLWLIGHVVAERGERDTEALANSLARPQARSRGRPSSLAVPLAAIIVLTLGVAALAATGTVHLPGLPGAVAPAIGTASPATLPDTALPVSTAPAMTFAPDAPGTEPAATGRATAPPIQPSTAAPPLPTLPVPLPTAPALPIPLPPLPTVPPLPTPHLPLPLTAP